jgi:hypothetical protein
VNILICRPSMSSPAQPCRGDQGHHHLIYTIKELKQRYSSSWPDHTKHQHSEQPEQQPCPKTLLVPIAVLLGKSRNESEQSSRSNLANVSCLVSSSHHFRDAKAYLVRKFRR